MAQGPKPASVYPEGIVELRRPRAAAPVAELKKPAGELEQLVSVRREFLTRYQDAAYAARYADLVDKVAHAEREATGTQRLALAVARYAFKLMAYKDEYEVARLYSDGEFERRVAQQFEGDWKLRFHLAPPLFSGAARTASRSSAPTARAPCACSACWRGCGACAARASIRSATPPSGAPSASWSGNTTRR